LLFYCKYLLHYIFIYTRVKLKLFTIKAEPEIIFGLYFSVMKLMPGYILRRQPG